MLFNSVEYFVLLTLAALAYWATRWLWLRQGILLVASVIFYVSWIPVYVLLLLGAVLITYMASQVRGRLAPFAITAAVVLDLAGLGLFKYADFLRQVTVDLAGPLIGVSSFSAWNIVLPLGISFYTFQLIAYAADVERGDADREKNPLLFALFIMFFPQLIAGPICRASQLMPQLRVLHRFDAGRLAQGMLLLASGLFLKVVIADNISGFVDQVFVDPVSHGSSECLLAALTFGVVILCDFWGYSTMAVGAALLFGIVIPSNFDLPYSATSLRDFWRRWHITLSTWLRDYLYKPLGGSRGGSWLTYRNLLLVMLLGGLWHGAAYTFIIWGAIHGVWLALERAARGLMALLSGDGVGPDIADGRSGPGLADPQSRALLQRATARLMSGFLALSGWAMTMLVVFVGWVFFRAASVDEAVQVLARTATLDRSGMTPAMLAIAPYLLVFLVLHVPLHMLHVEDERLQLGLAGRLVATAWLFTAAIVLGAGEVSEFIYFQF